MWQSFGASINPILFSSLNAFQILTNKEPLAAGTMMCFGVFQPSCSAISKPYVFEPSA